MSNSRRIQRINSLLKEVISEVISRDLGNHEIPVLVTVTEVDTTGDLRQAKVYVSLINGDEKAKEDLLVLLQKLAGYIGVLASKKVELRYFPTLTFKLDSSLDNYMHIDDLLRKIDNEQVE